MLLTTPVPIPQSSRAEMHTYETILTEMLSEHLLKVTLNRPEVGNAKNTQMGLDLLDLWTRLIDDPEQIRCVVLTGAGDRIFCAGGDLKQRKGMTPKEWQHQHEIFERGRDALLELSVPVIAATPMPADWRQCWSATSPTPYAAPASR
jgi:enoyl-CoA hydratase/carnithine racemase